MAERTVPPVHCPHICVQSDLDDEALHPRKRDRHHRAAPHVPQNASNFAKHSRCSLFPSPLAHGSTPQCQCTLPLLMPSSFTAKCTRNALHTATLAPQGGLPEAEEHRRACSFTKQSNQRPPKHSRSPALLSGKCQSMVDWQVSWGFVACRIVSPRSGTSHRANAEQRYSSPHASPTTTTRDPQPQQPRIGRAHWSCPCHWSEQAKIPSSQPQPSIQASEGS